EDWDAMPIGFPTCYDGSGYSPPLRMVISSDMVQRPWTKTNSPQRTQEQLLHSAGQALAGSLAMRGPVTGAVPLPGDWARRLHLHGHELRGAFFTGFYADVEPPGDGSTSARQVIASKTTCALGVQILTCSQSDEQCREILSRYHLQDRLKGHQQGHSEYNLLVWDTKWAMEWAERDMAAGAPNPFLISKSSLTVDFLAEMTHVWPPAPGARVSGTDRSCPAGIALVHCDATRNGPFHDTDDTVTRPSPGQAYYRVRTTRKTQFNRVNAAMREFFSIGCNGAALWGTALPPIVWALVFRHEGYDDKAGALAVPAQGEAADLLLAQASVTLERTIDDPDQPRANPRTGWGVGCFGGAGGSMDNLAEQFGNNLNPDNKDLFPRVAERRAHEDKVKGSVAKTITPAANTVRKSLEAKPILATHEAGADLRDKKFLICILDEPGQTSELMAIMSLNHAVRCGARAVLFGDERQLCPT
ncbi:unnamed protein product, partial [Prorocentrum cordatum]